MTEKPLEVILTRAELIHIMHSIGANKLAGLELIEFKGSHKQFQDLLRIGKQSLLSRSLLDTDTLAIAPGLIKMVEAISFREMAVILIRGIQGKGKQLFVFNFHGDVLVEHTMPVEGQHRLKTVESFKEFFDRVEDLIPLKPVLRNNRQQYSILQSDFEQIQRFVTSDPKKVRMQLMSLGLPDDMIRSLIKSLSHPVFTLSLAFIVMKKNKVLDASSTAVFANKEVSWGIWPGKLKKNELELLIFPSGINDINSALIDWLGLRHETKILDFLSQKDQL